MSYSVVIEAPASATSICYAISVKEKIMKNARETVVYCPDGVPNSRIREEIRKSLKGDESICVSMDRVYRLTKGDFLIHVPHNASITPEGFRRIMDQAKNETRYDRFAIKPMLTVYEPTKFNFWNGFLMVMIMMNWLQTIFSWGMFRSFEQSTEIRITVVTKKRSIRSGPTSYWMFQSRQNARYLRSGSSVIEYSSKGLDCVMRALHAHVPHNGILVDFPLYMSYCFLFGYPWTNLLFWYTDSFGASLMTPWTLGSWLLQVVILLFLTPKYLAMSYWYIYLVVLPFYITFYPLMYLMSKYFYSFSSYNWVRPSE